MSSLANKKGLARSAESLMADGGSILTMSYYGAARVVTHYNLMGPVKAALEASVRYMAAELGQQNIRVNALSPGPVQTRVASSLTDFDKLMEQAARSAPLHQLVTLEQIGEMVGRNPATLYGCWTEKSVLNRIPWGSSP